MVEVIVAVTLLVVRILGSDRELLVKIRARQPRFIGHVMRRGKIEDLSLTDRIPARL